MGRKNKRNKIQLRDHAEKLQATNSTNSTLENESTVCQSELFTCEVSPIYGRYLKSRVNIAKGTIILSEKYLIAGPQRSSDVVCVGCHSDFENKTERKSCPRCFWPICSSQCAASEFHAEECKFFTEKCIKAPTRFGNSEFGSLTVLRGLMLKYNNPLGWQSLMELEAHNEIRKNLPLWRENTLNVVDVIQKDWNLAQYFTEEEVHTVCGILEVNAFEIGEKFSYRGIFPKAAMMAHDWQAIPNTTRFENPVTGVLMILAAVDIPAATVLSTCYAFSLEATAQRRKMLTDTKFFCCKCRRCDDPFELNSNMSTIVCQVCKVGDVINTGVCDLNNLWACQSETCKAKIPQSSIESQLLMWRNVADRVYDITNCEKVLSNCKALFHPSHFIPFDVKFNLCQAYGREGISLEALSDANLDRKLELCREVMKVLDIVTPGYTVTRGLILYELQAAEIINARRLQEHRKIIPLHLRRKLQLTLKTLQESITILGFCYPGSIEYEMSQAAKVETLVELSKWIKSLK